MSEVTGSAPPSAKPRPPSRHAAVENLGRRTARGVIVTLGGQLSQIVLQMTSVIVLARLLSPHDYGLYAMVLIIAGVGEIFRDFGLSSAAIQAKVLSNEERTNLFWLNAGIGLVLTTVVFLGAPVIADIFGQHELVPIARALSAIFLVNGMVTQFRADLNRRMKFAQLAISDLSGQAVAVTVAIVCAALGAHYWALVGSQLAQVLTVLILVVSQGRWLPGRPRRDVSLKPFLRFGIGLVATQLINYAGNNLDSLTIAFRFGPSPLGVYNRAFQLLMNPLNQFRTPATTVALPVLSRLQDDLPRASAYIRRGQIAIGYTIVAGLAFGAAAAKPLTQFLLGSRWQSVSTIFTLLAIAGIFQMLSFVGYWVYLSRGLTKDLFRYTLISFGIKAVCIVGGSHWGVTGVAAGYAIAPGLSWPLSLWWLQRRTDLPTADLIRGAARILGVAAVSGTGVFAVTRLCRHQADLIQLVLGLLVAVTVYTLAAAGSAQVREDLKVVREFGRQMIAR